MIILPIFGTLIRPGELRIAEALEDLVKGPFITLYLCLPDGALRGAGYHSYACPAANAGASELAEFIIGMTATEALAIQSNQLLELLGGLLEGKHDRLDLALTALKTAVTTPINQTT